MISKQDHAHEPESDQIRRCKHCSMWQCFNGRWHEKGTTCITAECKQELEKELAAKEVKPHLTAEEVAKKHGFIPRSYSPCQFEKCVAAIKEFLSQVPETLYCDVCESELQRESCNHVRPCPKCTLEGPVQKPQRDACQVCEDWRGGVPGNENIVRGVTMCDYCSATVVELEKLGLMPATPAPSQPAARETGLKKAQDWWDSQYPARSEGQYPTVPHALNDYARQQTAAKDAELADLRRQRDLEWESRKAASSGRIAAERERDSLREALKPISNTVAYLRKAYSAGADAEVVHAITDLQRYCTTVDAALKAGKDGQ